MKNSKVFQEPKPYYIRGEKPSSKSNRVSIGKDSRKVKGDQTKLARPEFPKEHDVSECDCKTCKAWILKVDEWARKTYP